MTISRRARRARTLLSIALAALSLGIAPSASCTGPGVLSRECPDRDPDQDHGGSQPSSHAGCRTSAEP